jgi:hypothetical protein
MFFHCVGVAKSRHEVFFSSIHSQHLARKGRLAEGTRQAVGMIGGEKVARSIPMLGAPQTLRLALPGPRRGRQSALRSRFIVNSIFAAVAAAP